MIIVNFLGEINHRNRTLYLWGLFYVLLFFLALLTSLFDHRQLLGINVWVKPSKFAISIAINMFTMAWLTYYLPDKRTVRVYTYTAVIVFLIEIFAIFTQAGRGVMSHFNISTRIDALIFQTMGIAIAINSLFVLYFCVLFFIRKTSLPQPFLWAIRLGLLFFVIFTFEGFVMALQLAHTVGAPDGGPGLPYLNWSKQHGDLRIAHLLGIHSIQLLPLCGWLVGESSKSFFTRFGTLFIILLASLYLLFTISTYQQAIQGISITRFTF
ncbi:hypothetical protein [Solitalea lacus]|uniref:hypothetical protein n=1 Tax=Solitalea lacus TaxID=2911172 RepID=UPI001EDB87C6|nr:hypothetical protein [Solitalea lacus]UKJ08404.1 hypothetical protein L2B55_04335 [Solitalea lacus]